MEVASIDPGSGQLPADAELKTAIVFVIDTTVSMKPYIERTREAVRNIYDAVEAAGMSDRIKTVSGNMTADPMFCNRPGGDLTIDAASPCAPDNSSGCGLIGALDVGCDSPVHAKSWGAIKSMYR